MHRGETSIYRALFTQKARKFSLLHLQTICHINILLNINALNNSIQNHMAIYRGMPEMLCQLKIKKLCPAQFHRWMIRRVIHLNLPGLHNYSYKADAVQ